MHVPVVWLDQTWWVPADSLDKPQGTVYSQVYTYSQLLDSLEQTVTSTLQVSNQLMNSSFPLKLKGTESRDFRLLVFS